MASGAAIEEVTVENFEAFVAEANRLVHEDGERHRGLSEDDKAGDEPLLFRGHSDSDWRLETTLERWLAADSFFDGYPAESYHNSVQRAALTIRDLLGERFESTQFSNNQVFRGKYFPQPELLNLYVFLRHLGFPSPLLDWTKSFWVAAYFAFSDFNARTKPAIYAFKPADGSVRGGFIGDPAIWTIPSTASGHKRHYTQQSSYSICHALKEDRRAVSYGEESENGVRYYFPHYSVESLQDGQKITKYVIQDRKSLSVLSRLKAMNITAYTLFHDEESLIRTLALECFGVDN